MEKNSITISEVMSYLVKNCVPNLPPYAIAEVFDRLIWCLSDNGEGILNVRKDWLSGDDFFKVKVALAMTETYPYETRDEMVSKFNEIKEKWPMLKEQCDKILESVNT